MVWLDGDIVGEFGVIDMFEDRKSLANCRDTNLLERVDVENGEDVARDIIL